jgi:6-pyruvoyltetrahydropterin/6-carboxytetrahydropterin synthase
VFTCSKTYADVPFAHRAHMHKGHCRLIHGHNWSFQITFAATTRDENGFVVDFGKLKELRQSLWDIFDHKLVVSQDDPLLSEIGCFLRDNMIANLTVVPDCSCEGIAEFVHGIADAFVRKETINRARVVEVIVHESSCNVATFRP